jgi:hypothetical protein
MGEDQMPQTKHPRLVGFCNECLGNGLNTTLFALWAIKIVGYRLGLTFMVKYPSVTLNFMFRLGPRPPVGGKMA